MTTFYWSGYRLFIHLSFNLFSLTDDNYDKKKGQEIENNLFFIIIDINYFYLIYL